MKNCPICGSSITDKDNTCINCGYNFPESVTEEAASSNPGQNNNHEIEKKGTTGIDSSDNNEYDKRQKWLEQQKSLKDELSGIKSLMDEEQVMQETSGQYPEPSNPLPSTIRPDAGLQLKNFNTQNPGIQNSTPAEQPVYSKPLTVENDDHIKDGMVKNDDDQIKENKPPKEMGPVLEIKLKTPESMEIKVAKSSQFKSPSKLKVKQKDLIKVDTILENSSDVKPRKDTEIAGAIDRILTHEKKFKSKNIGENKQQTVKQNAPDTGETPSSLKNYKTNDILKYLEKSLRTTSDRFHRKPIDVLIEKAQKKLSENNIDAAYSIAVNAKKVFNRSLKEYETARNSIRILRESHPEIMSPANPRNKKYEQLISNMKAGQYTNVLKQIEELTQSYESTPQANEIQPDGAEDIRSIPIAQPASKNPAQSSGMGTANNNQSADTGSGRKTSGDFSRWKKKRGRRRRKRG